MPLYCSGLSSVVYLQSVLHNYEELILFFSHVGDPRNTFLVLFPFLYCLSTSLGLKVLWTSAIVEWLNALLKWLVRDDRPYWYQSETCLISSAELKQFPITCESGPGFPSGHVMANSALGLLIILHIQSVIRLKKNQLYFLIVVIPIFICTLVFVAVSRVYIATHFPHQVIAGAIVGCVSAVLINSLFNTYSLHVMFSPVAIIVGIGSLLVGTFVYYTLMVFDLNPLATVSFALNNCALRDWVHLDTTLFFAITRDAGCLTGLGLTSWCVSVFIGTQARAALLEGKLPLYVSWVCIMVICPLVYALESFRIPQDKLLTFYIVAFIKFALLPCYVITIKCSFEILCEWSTKKCKIR